MRWMRWMRWAAAAAFVLFLSLTASQAFAFTEDGNRENDPTGIVYPTVAAIGNDFLAGAQAFDESIQAVLPIGKAWAGDRADELPLPIGLTFAYNHQWETLRITRLAVNLDGGAPIDVPPGLISDIRASTNTYSLIGDVWILPFWNVFGVVAYSEGTAKLSVHVPGILPNGTFNQKYDVLTLGGGTNLTVGWRDFFLVANGTWTVQDVNVLESRVNAFVAAPRVGWQGTVGPTSLAIWTGANYLHISQHQYGNTDFDIPGVGQTKIHYDLDIHEVGAWNAALGGRVSLGKRFDFVLDGGIGTRKSILASVDFRF